MQLFAIWNPKGGVGKSTLSVNLASYFANENQRTLLIDLDPQRSVYSLSKNGVVRTDDPIGGFKIVYEQPLSKPDADIVIVDHPPVHTLPKPAILIMPTSLDPFSWASTVAAAKDARGHGRKVVIVANRVDVNRKEEAEALSVLKKMHPDTIVIRSRSIYPRVIGMRKSIFDEDLRNLYGVREARAEISNLGKFLTELA